MGCYTWVLQGVFDKRPNMAIDLPFMEEAWHHIFNQPKIVQRKVGSLMRCTGQLFTIV